MGLRPQSSWVSVSLGQLVSRLLVLEHQMCVPGGPVWAQPPSPHPTGLAQVTWVRAKSFSNLCPLPDHPVTARRKLRPVKGRACPISHQASFFIISDLVKAFCSIHLFKEAWKPWGHSGGFRGLSCLWLWPVDCAVEMVTRMGSHTSGRWKTFPWRVHFLLPEPTTALQSLTHALLQSRAPGSSHRLSGSWRNLLLDTWNPALTLCSSAPSIQRIRHAAPRLKAEWRGGGHNPGTWGWNPGTSTDQPCNQALSEKSSPSVKRLEG